MDIFLINDIGAGFYDIGLALTSDLGVWWLLIPIFLLWIAMEVYFGEYKQERMGFSSTLANGVTLFWISLTSFRIFLFTQHQYLDIEIYTDPRVFLLGFFVLYALFVIYVSFTHSMHPRVAQMLAGPSLTYYFTMISVLWGQRLLGISIPVMYALIILFGGLALVFYLLRRQLGLRGDIERVQQIADEPTVHV